MPRPRPLITDMCIIVPHPMIRPYRYPVDSLMPRQAGRKPRRQGLWARGPLCRVLRDTPAWHSGEGTRISALHSPSPCITPLGQRCHFVVPAVVVISAFRVEPRLTLPLKNGQPRGLRSLWSSAQGTGDHGRDVTGAPTAARTRQASGGRAQAPNARPCYGERTAR